MHVIQLDVLRSIKSHADAVKKGIGSMTYEELKENADHLTALKTTIITELGGDWLPPGLTKKPSGTPAEAEHRRKAIDERRKQTGIALIDTLATEALALQDEKKKSESQEKPAKKSKSYRYPPFE